jgi:xanthine dehydrogenase accessory factor
MPQDWSVSATDVLEAAGSALADGSDAVLATVVGVQGNAYRRPGAKMLVTPEGLVGAITAGCLEDEVERIADTVLDAGERRVETYDLMEDDEDVWGLGVGCNGVIDLLLEPVDESLRPAIDATVAGDPLVVATVLGGTDAGTRAVFDPNAGSFRPATTSDSIDDALAETLLDPSRRLLAAGQSDTVTVDTTDGEATVFLDPLTPPKEVVVLGSGHDVGPVVEVANGNGFRTTVVGFRGAVDLAERFPHADRTATTSPAQLDSPVDLDEETAVVVMTHNFVDDRLAVEALLETPVPYVGLMGPRDRFEEMLEAFADEGRTVEETELDRLYTPVGLDLGTGTPYGIATSIVAEILTVLNERSPQHLSTREGPIHERLDVDQFEATDD